MKSFFTIFFLSFLVISCQNIEHTEKPENLIPKGKMVDIITELYLLNGAKTYNSKILESTGIEPNEYILNKFEIDSLQLVNSNNYYAENYEEYEKIYLGVKEKLEKYQTYFDTLRVREERRRDSIRALDPEDSLKMMMERAKRDSLINFPDTSATIIPYPVSKEVPLSRDRS